jgi:hypothetical protein
MYPYPPRGGRGGRGRGGQTIVTAEQLLQLAERKGMSIQELSAEIGQYEREGRLEQIGKEIMLHWLQIF